MTNTFTTEYLGHNYSISNMNDNVKLLKRSEIINRLKEEEVDLILANMTKVMYRKGEGIVKKGEYVTHILFLVKGYSKICTDFKNKQIIINVCGPSSYPGLTSMIGMDKHVFDISALDDSIIFLIDKKIIMDLIESNGSFAKDIILSMNDAFIHYIHHNLVSLTHNNIHGRLALLLLHFSTHVFCSDNFDLLLTRKELSQFSNISRENVTKVLSEFNKEGIIRLNGKHIQILHPEKLNHYSDIG